MKDLDVDPEELIEYFSEEQDSPYLYLKVDAEDIDDLVGCVSRAFRQCYISDSLLQERADDLEVTLGGSEQGRKIQIIRSKLPSKGSILSGDFGEILTYLYHAAAEHPKDIIGPKKWSIKQDRNSASPKSDVVLFSLAEWPNASEDDVVHCFEVKAMATKKKDATPIQDAINDCEKDRTSRLADTLVWLKDRAMERDLGSVEIAHLDRFINAIDYPEAKYQFNAVAVICSSLVEDQIKSAPDQADPEYNLLIISVPELKKTYTKVFESAGDEQ
jgi:hypothetical protein